MPSQNKKTRLLDHQLRAASETDAAFLATSDIKFGEAPEEVLEAFNHRYKAAAEALSKITPAHPMGAGGDGECRNISGIILTWEKEAWRSHGPGYTLEIGPECDQKDITHWLIEFKPVKNRVLSRPSKLRKTLDFILGEAANRIKADCIAFARGSIVGFPTTKNGCHILGVKLAEASKLEPDLLPVDLNKVLLHEIGHTMREHYTESRSKLSSELALFGPTNWDKAEAVIREISPHYLGDQFQTILCKLAECHVRLHAEPESPQRKEDWKVTWALGGELFAELCRHFYLDAVLEKKPRAFKNTGFSELDDLCNELCHQAKLTIAKSKAPLDIDHIDFD